MAEQQSVGDRDAARAGVRRDQRLGQRMPFELQQDAAFQRVQVQVPAVALQHAQLVLRTMEQLVRERHVAVGDVVGQGPDQLGPAHAAPLDRRAGDDDVGRQRADEDGPRGLEHAAGVGAVGHGRVVGPVDQQDGPAQRVLPKLAAVLPAQSRGLLEQGLRPPRIDRRAGRRRRQAQETGTRKQQGQAHGHRFTSRQGTDGALCTRGRGAVRGGKASPLDEASSKGGGIA